MNSHHFLRLILYAAFLWPFVTEKVSDNTAARKGAQRKEVYILVFKLGWHENHISHREEFTNNHRAGSLLKVSSRDLFLGLIYWTLSC